jgi:hypothetical protein
MMFKRSMISGSLSSAIVCGLTVFSGFSYSYESNNNSAQYQVLQNTSYEGCAYSGEVAISVDYSLHSAGFGELLVSGIQDGQGITLKQMEIEAGHGSTLVMFELNDCLDNIKVTINPF